MLIRLLQRHPVRAFFFVGTSVVVLASCAAIAGIDGLEIAACKGGDCAPETSLEDHAVTADVEVPDASDVLPSTPCPGDGGPTMVRVGTSSNNFCIDSTEVTVGQYRAFLDAKPDAAAQDAVCAWNKSFEASGAGVADAAPQAGVDWCDAHAYCKWAGKRLCGKIVASANPNAQLTLGELASPDVSQWFIACSAAGKQNFPYGGELRHGACNFQPSDAGADAGDAAPSVLPVPAPDDAGGAPDAACAGGYPGVYDMLGNVWEWMDYCQDRDAGPDAGDGGVDGGEAKKECFVRGGSYLVDETLIDCRSNGTGATRDGRSSEIGIRCCAE